MATWVPLVLSDSAPDRETVLLVTGEWPPFTSQKMDKDGFFTAVVKHVFERMGQPYEVRFMPWKRSVAMVEQGNAFATFPYRTTEKREKKHHFSDPVTTSTGRFFYLDSRFPDGLQWQDYNDLKDYKIGGTLGYWYEKKFRQADLDIEFVRDDVLNFRKLVFERVDIVAAGERVGWHVLHQHFPDAVEKVSVAEKPMNENTLRLMVSRDYPDSEQLLKRFNRHLEEFKESPSFEKLQSQYDAFGPSTPNPAQHRPE